MKTRSIAYFGPDCALREARLKALRTQNIKTEVLEDLGASVAASEAGAVVLDGSVTVGHELEAMLARLSGNFPPVLVIFPEPEHGEAPVRLRRAAVIQAGASDAMLANADLDEFLTRVRALLLTRTLPRVLVVEDEAEIADWVLCELSAGGYQGVAACSLLEAHTVFALGPVDVLIIDRRLPDGDGLDFVQEIRERGIRTPAMVYTSMNRGDERVSGLERGADDYLCKPIHAEELRARIAVLLRPALWDGTQYIGALEIAHRDGLARWKGQRLDLRQREYSLLAYLAARESLRIPQRMLFEDIWQRSHLDPEANPVTQTKHRLVRALRAAGLPDIIATENDCYCLTPGPLLNLDASEGSASGSP